MFHSSNERQDCSSSEWQAKSASRRRLTVLCGRGFHAAVDRPGFARLSEHAYHRSVHLYQSGRRDGEER